MMVRKLPAAEDDLLDIWLHIATDSPTQADRFLTFLNDKINLLATAPRMGRVFDGLEGIRLFPIQDYVIFYREDLQAIEIVRVLHGARDIEGLFKNTP